MFGFIKNFCRLFSVVGLVLSVFFLPSANAAISSVEFVHKTILELKNITVPIPNNVSEIGINSVRYLLEQIDHANEILNGGPTSNYANSEMASKNPVDADKAINNIDELIVKMPAFTMHIENASTFSFAIAARGEFIIDWGDGNITQLTSTNTNSTSYSHPYATAGNYTVKLYGLPDAYNNSGTSAAISFAGNTALTKIEGNLSKVFPRLASSGLPSFQNTFQNCTNLGGPLPAELFADYTGQIIPRMFQYTFSGCTSLSGEIPAGLFGNFTGNGASNMFFNTFQNCSGLSGEIPAGLFGNMTGSAAANMYNSTFFGCSGLTGKIPDNLFGSFTGNAVASMYTNTFTNCTGLTSIGNDIFGKFDGVNADYMFQSTFSNCTGLTGEIPAGLFGNMTGTPKRRMFLGTFSNCRGLTGSIPAGLFGTISGAPQDGVFQSTFSGCIGLDGEVPAGLFGTLTGNPAGSMFLSTFQNTRLSRIVDGIWDLSGMNNESATNMFNNTFNNNPNLESSAPTIAAGNPTKLWEHFTVYAGQKAFQGNNLMPDYLFIPVAWGGIGVNPADAFILSVSDTSSFSFTLSAKGNFAVDWGDGTMENITRVDVTNTTYSHTYAASGNYTVKIYGLATAYSTAAGTPAISFNAYADKTKITAIDGNLSSIFPTLSNGINPCFASTFAGMTGISEIPPNLFANLTGLPVNSMFRDTFNGCTGITGSIPPKLFGNISGRPITNMFNGTFRGCTNLSGEIPGDLFSGISGAPATYMYDYTFYNCAKLTGSIPPGLFGAISGAPQNNMFENTFSGCVGLTGSIPPGLFGTLDGAPGTSMFLGTFNGCRGLTGSVPAGLFGTLRGALTRNTFQNTFTNCTGLTGIEDGIWDITGLNDTSTAGTFQSMFLNCTGITSPSPTIAPGNPTKMWEKFIIYSGQGAFKGSINMSDYADMPTGWK